MANRLKKVMKPFIAEECKKARRAGYEEGVKVGWQQKLLAYENEIKCLKYLLEQVKTGKAQQRFLIKRKLETKGLMNSIIMEPAIIPVGTEEIIPIQPAMQWISVKDRLPENDQKVLCFNYNGEYKVLRWNYIDWMWNSGIEWLKEDYVLYWMPLPEPPNMEVNKNDR